MNRLFTFLFLSLLFNIVQAQLRSPEYQKGKAILSGTIANYSPDDHPDLKIGAPNIVMGAAETLFPTIEADGSFKINIPLYHNTRSGEQGNHEKAFLTIQIQCRRGIR